MGSVSNNLNKHCSLYSGTVLKVTAVKDLVRECLRPFPYIWASFDNLNLWYMPHVFDLPQL
jgi:hypothetical protein